VRREEEAGRRREKGSRRGGFSNLMSIEEWKWRSEGGGRRREDDGRKEGGRGEGPHCVPDDIRANRPAL